MDVVAQTTVTWELCGTLKGADGYSVDLGTLDNSFRCWRQIVRWNLHYRHWRCLAGNTRDLFTKTLKEALWRHLSLTVG